MLRSVYRIPRRIFADDIFAKTEQKQKNVQKHTPGIFTLSCISIIHRLPVQPYAGEDRAVRVQCSFSNSRSLLPTAADNHIVHTITTRWYYGVGCVQSVASKVGVSLCSVVIFEFSRGDEIVSTPAFSAEALLVLPFGRKALPRTKPKQPRICVGSKALNAGHSNRCSASGKPERGPRSLPEARLCSPAH